MQFQHMFSLAISLVCSISHIKRSITDQQCLSGAPSFMSRNLPKDWVGSLRSLKRAFPVKPLKYEAVLSVKSYFSRKEITSGANEPWTSVWQGFFFFLVQFPYQKSSHMAVHMLFNLLNCNYDQKMRKEVYDQESKARGELGIWDRPIFLISPSGNRCHLSFPLAWKGLYQRDMLHL